MAKAVEKKAKIGVLGASGYTGAELVRLLLRHPRAEIALLTADRRAGQEMARRLSAVFAVRAADAGVDRRHRLEEGRPRSRLLRAAARHHPEGDQGSARQGAEDQGGRPLRRLPACRRRRLCPLVRPRAPCAGAAKGGGLRPGRGLPQRHHEGAAGRQSRLLHDLRAASAHSAAQGQGDRSRRDRDRRQVRHDRSGQGGEGGDAVLGSVGRLPRLWRRPPPAHGRARPGILQGRRPRGGRQLHPAPRAHEPWNLLDHLCARPRNGRPKTFMRYF